MARNKTLISQEDKLLEKSNSLLDKARLADDAAAACAADDAIAMLCMRKHVITEAAYEALIEDASHKVQIAESALAKERLYPEYERRGSRGMKIYKQHPISSIESGNTTAQGIRLENNELWCLRIMAAHSNITMSALMRTILIEAIDENSNALNQFKRRMQKADVSNGRNNKN